MKTILRILAVLSICGVALAQQSYVKYQDSPGANPRWVRGPAFTDLAWTNSQGVIQPISTNAFKIDQFGGLSIGQTGYVGLASSAGQTLVGWRFTNDNLASGLSIGVSDNASAANYGTFYLDAYVDYKIDFGWIQLTNGTYTEIAGLVPEAYLWAYTGDTELWELEPSSSASSRSYLFNTLLFHTSGNLVEFQNDDTNKVWITHSGTLASINGFASYASAGAAPTAITFPVSDANWTNTTGVNIELYIDNVGITGTAIKKNGTTILSGIITGYTMLMGPGDYFSETYSIGTPTARYSKF